MSDNICKSCGTKGYLPLFGNFECENEQCSAFKGGPKKDPGSALLHTLPGGFVYAPYVPSFVTVSASAATVSPSNISMKDLINYSDPNQIQHQRDLGREILLDFKPFNLDAIIAGGAVRNWKFGAEARDLDFYINCPDLSSFNHLIITSNIFADDATSWKYNWAPNNQLQPTKKNGYAAAGLMVATGKYKGQEIQVISHPSISNPVDFVKGFDFGINQIYTDLDNIDKIMFSKQILNADGSSRFLKDLSHLTLTVYIKDLIESVNDHKNLAQRAEKMQTLFPTYLIKIA